MKSTTNLIINEEHVIRWHYVQSVKIIEEKVYSKLKIIKDKEFLRYQSGIELKLKISYFSGDSETITLTRSEISDFDRSQLESIILKRVEYHSNFLNEKEHKEFFQQIVLHAKYNIILTDQEVETTLNTVLDSIKKEIKIEKRLILKKIENLEKSIKFNYKSHQQELKILKNDLKD